MAESFIAWLVHTPVWRMRLRYLACRARLWACPLCRAGGAHREARRWWSRKQVDSDHFPGCPFPHGDHTAACREDFARLQARIEAEVNCDGS